MPRPAMFPVMTVTRLGRPRKKDRSKVRQYRIQLKVSATERRILFHAARSAGFKVLADWYRKRLGLAPSTNGAGGSHPRRRAAVGG